MINLDVFILTTVELMGFLQNVKTLLTKNDSNFKYNV